MGLKLPSCVAPDLALYVARAKEMPLVRGPIMWCRSLGRHPERAGDRLISVMYHRLPAGARRSFERQLDYMRSVGDFVSATQAVELLKSGDPMGGRYFCVTFDDGELDAYQNALPILTERGIPSVSFVVPFWTAAATRDEDAVDRRYVSWNECRHMAGNGVEIGSHSLSHRRIATLAHGPAQDEIIQSKLRVERELARLCVHFACPWGQPGGDYLPGRDPLTAAAAGYQSFFTTIRGAAMPGASRWAIPRIRLEPDWGLAQLRYQFSR
jgi:peptidoglycan/xylan/chitin deacetylase (PgdA/CDA1 family)